MAPVCSTERPARPFLSSNEQFSGHTDRTCQDGADEDMDFPSIVLITSDVSTAPEGQQNSPFLLDQQHAATQTIYSGLWLLNQVLWITTEGRKQYGTSQGIHARVCKANVLASHIIKWEV